MKAHKLRIVVLEDGRLVLENVPVQRGEQVEVVILIDEPPAPTFPLRGTKIRYEDPFQPAVDDAEWDAAK